MRLLAFVCLAGCSFDASLTMTNPGTDAGDTDGTTIMVDGPPGCTNHALPPSPHVEVTQWSAAFLTAPVWNCTSAGTTTIDTSNGNITNPCGATDITNDVPQKGGGQNVLVVPLRGLNVTTGRIVRVTGNKPIVFLVEGNVVIDTGGLIDVGANGMLAGPGAVACADRAAGLGVTSAGGGWGGGGGGFATAGGQGGYNTTNGGAGATQTLTPLRGGCAGAPTTGGAVFGAGGGAIAISATGTISIGPTGSAAISAAGGGGPVAATGGGNGGGSGGGVYVIAAGAKPTFGGNGAIRAHGGSGSSGDNASSGGGTNLAGRDGHATDNNRATDTSGTAGTSNNDRGRAGGLAFINNGGAMEQPGDLPNPQTQGGRGGGGGGGGALVVDTGAVTPACD